LEKVKLDQGTEVGLMTLANDSSRVRHTSTRRRCAPGWMEGVGSKQVLAFRSVPLNWPQMWVRPPEVVSSWVDLNLRSMSASSLADAER